MRDAGERVELFGLLAKLFSYLISGRSHVGYLFNYAANPIHYIPYVIQDSITVQIPPAGSGRDQGDIEMESQGSSLSEPSEIEGNDMMMID